MKETTSSGTGRRSVHRAWPLLFLLVASCASVESMVHSTPPLQYPGEISEVTELETPNLVSASYVIADNLIQNLAAPLTQDRPVLIASIVDVRNMEESSNFGRMMSECIGSRLAQLGYTIKEMKLRETVYIKENAGEFLLSRNLQDLTASHDAQAVVVGTYAWAITDVYVATRIVRAADGKVVSSCDVRLPVDINLRAMLHNE